MQHPQSIRCASSYSLTRPGPCSHAMRKHLPAICQILSFTAKHVDHIADPYPFKELSRYSAICWLEGTSQQGYAPVEPDSALPGTSPAPPDGGSDRSWCPTRSDHPSLPRRHCTPQPVHKRQKEVGSLLQCQEQLIRVSIAGLSVSCKHEQHSNRSPRLP